MTISIYPKDRTILRPYVDDMLHHLLSSRTESRFNGYYTSAISTKSTAKIDTTTSTTSHTPRLFSSLRDRLPVQAPTLFEAKAAKNLTFEDIAKQLGRNEVAVAAIFYGQAQTTSEDAEKLADILGVDKSKLSMQLAGYPFRGQVMDMPPKEPLIYRLYEIVQNYGYAYKAVLNEKFGDGIMSAISFSTKVEKETDKDGNNWAVITLRGKWLPFSRF